MHKWLVLPLALAACAGNVTVPSSRPSERVARATDLGRLRGDTELDVVLGLSLRRPQQLKKLLDERAAGDALSPGDFADLFAPTRADYGRVLAWLDAGGLWVTRASEGRTTVSVHGSAAQLERLFGVELHQYSDGDGTFAAANAPLVVGVDLVNLVSGVVGLDGAGAWRSHLHVPDAQPNASPPPLTPSDLHTQYNSSAIASPGAGETVAIVGAGSPPTDADISDFLASFAPYGITSTTSYRRVLLGGNNRDPDSLAKSEYVENCLDVDMVLGMAPLATVQHVIVATNAPGLFTDGISYVVNQLPQAHAVSVSYGTCERGAAGSAPVLDALMMQAEAEGQQWFFSSGDSGTDGCRDGGNNKQISAGWPASSPYVVGVGGTMLASNVEVVWNESTSAAAVGPGAAPSEMYVKPPYQVGLTAPNVSPQDGARWEADVSAIAGAPYVIISANGRHGGVGGTSVAAPLWAGVWALVDQGKGGTGIKDALTKIYAAGAKAGSFHDVTMGDNGGPDGSSKGFSAGPGYDLPSGWGTPNVAALITNLP